MTLEQVKSDLKEIQYYYANQKDLEGAARIIGTSKIAEKVKLYNEAVRKAPVKLYEVYPTPSTCCCCLPCIRCKPLCSFVTSEIFICLSAGQRRHRTSFGIKLFSVL